MQDAKNPRDSQDREGHPKGFWECLVNICRRYAANERRQGEEEDRQNNRKIATWTKATGIGTIIAAIGAIVAAFIFGGQLWIMWDDSIEANRAWVAPNIPDAKFPANIGETIRSRFYFGNIGKTPATQALVRFSYFNIEMIPSPIVDATALKPPPNLTCESTDPRIKTVRLGTLWPSTNPNFYGINSGHSEPVDADYFAKKKVYGIQGCFKYMTFGRPKFSRFCFLFEPNSDAEKWGNCQGDGQFDAN